MTLATIGNLVATGLIAGAFVLILVRVSKLLFGIDISRHHGLVIATVVTIVLGSMRLARDVGAAIPIVGIVVGTYFIVLWTRALWFAIRQLELAPNKPPELRRMAAIGLVGDEAVLCPHCKQVGMSPAEKVSLGPLKSHPCGNCGAAIGVSWFGLLVMSVPGLVGIIGLRALGVTPVSVAVGVLAILGMLSALPYLVRQPLVKK